MFLKNPGPQAATPVTMLLGVKPAGHVPPAVAKARSKLGLTVEDLDGLTPAKLCEGLDKKTLNSLAQNLRSHLLPDAKKQYGMLSCDFDRKETSKLTSKSIQNCLVHL